MQDHVLGAYDPAKVSGLPVQWFIDRQVELLDFRGDLQIRHPESLTLGRKVIFLTASHDISNGYAQEMTLKRVWLDDYVFIGSAAVLYNCEIQSHGIVACGAVVRNMTVPPYSIVEGNPAKVISTWDSKKRMYIPSIH